MPIRINGMNSGLDTESIVTALVSGYKTKKDKLVKAQTKQQWKMDAWKGVNTKVYDLYKSLDKMRLSSAGYKTKKTTVSDTTKASVTASSNALNGTQTLKINKLASAGYITGGELSSSTTGSSTLGSLGLESSGTITVGTKDGTTDINVDSSTTINDLVSKLKDAGVNASFDESNHRFFVSAKESGASNDFSMTASNIGGLAALNVTGLNVESTSGDAMYKSYGAYALNTNGEALYTYNDDGTVTTNGTYDETKTRENIANVLDTLKEYHNNVTNATTDNARYARQKAYANADAENNSLLADGSTKSKINGLLSASSTYAAVSDDGTVTEYTGRTEAKDESGNTLTDENGKTLYDYTYTDSEGKEQKYRSSDDLTVSTQLTDLAKEAGLITNVTDGEENTVYEEDGTTPKTDETKWNTYKSNYNTVKTFNEAPDAEDEAFITRVANAQADGATESVSDIVAELDGKVATNNSNISTWNTYISDNSTWDVSGIASMSGPAATEDTDLANQLSEAMDKIAIANTALTTGLGYSSTATRVNGEDAQIVLNDATFSSSSNKFNINGLTINATATTAPGESITITTASDTQATYDKIKDFLTQYNEVMNSLSTSYNAEAAKGYEPLTDEEKEAMSDTEVEKWETKIKSSLLRRDQTLSGIMSTISNSMSKSYSVTMADGTTKSLSLASLGIKTAGYFSSSATDRNALHIDGDEDDDISSANADKLMKMIEEDPDAVESLMKQVTQGLYDNLDKKMKSTTMSSAYTIYNDKEMGKEYSNYTTQIKTWETRLADMEERYYKQFAAMEKALATLNSNSSSLTGMLGG